MSLISVRKFFRWVYLFVAFLLLWLVLTEGFTLRATPTTSYLVGLPAAALCAWLWLYLRPEPLQLRWLQLPHFFAHFVLQSILAGFDVARRVLTPSLPLHPGTVLYPIRLESPSSTLFFASVVSLMPGTLCCRIEAKQLRIHVLDRDQNIAEALFHTEKHIARLFGQVNLPSTPAELVSEPSS